MIIYLTPGIVMLSVLLVPVRSRSQLWDGSGVPESLIHIVQLSGSRVSGEGFQP